MTKEQIMLELFEFSAPTYYKWTKHEKRKIFDLINYAFTLAELEEFMLKLNDFDTRYNSYTNSLDSEEKTLDTISSMTRYKIISYIENTPKEILEFALNFI